MSSRPTPLRNLDSPGSAERANRLGTRFRHAQQPARRSLIARLGKRLLVVYWASCLTVIVLGLDTLYPDVRPALAARFDALTQGQSSARRIGSLEFTAPSRMEPEPEPEPEAAPLPKHTRPFPNCATAHDAGVYNIPAGSPAYSPRQDGDGDGLACEPY